MRRVQRALATLLLMSDHMLVVVLATSWNDAIIVMTTSETMSPYSIAVAPRRSDSSFLSRRNIELKILNADFGCPRITDEE